MTALGDVVTITDCEHRTARECLPSDRYAWSVGTKAIRGGRIIYDQARPVDAPTYKQFTARREPVNGDIIFAREAPVGDCVLVPVDERVCLGQRTVLLSADTTHLNARYLYFLLHSSDAQAWMERHSAGSTVRHLNVRDIYNVPLGTLPSLREQKRIAGLLGALDDLIETDLSLASEMEQLAQEKAGGPSQWVSLQHLAEAPPLRQRKPAGVVDHYSIPAYDSGRLPLREAGEAILSGKQVLASDSVLVSRLNPTTERAWMAYPDSEVPAVCSPEFVVLRGINGTPTEVIWALTSTGRFWDQMRSSVGGTTNSRQRVDKSSIPSLKVPDARQLDASATRAITQLVRGAVELRYESAELARQRDELLPLLMSGKVRVRDVEAVAS